jgi:hypothetical protein
MPGTFRVAASHPGSTRAVEAVVDDLNDAPAELLGAIDEAVAPPALMIVRELVCRRLPDVDAGAAREMLSGDLGSSPLSPSAAFAGAAAISRSATSITVASSQRSAPLCT